MNKILNEYKNKNILVTGGLGFIGSNLVPELRNRGHEVWIPTKEVDGSCRLKKI